jgi:gliotoxin/aspirochlorine biosynthesis aminotransferase
VCLGSFEISAVLRNGVKVVPVSEPAQQADYAQSIVAAYQIAADEAAASGTRIRGLLFCNPHNPHGHVYTAEVLDALLQFCEQADIHFLSDEIYALSTFGRVDAHAAGEPTQRAGKGFTSPSAHFVSVLSRNLERLGVNASRVHMLYSISKDFGCSGLRLVRTSDNPAPSLWYPR